MKKIAIFLGLMICAASANAVDGYKGIKFGASIDEVKKTHLCTLKPYKNDLPEMNTMACEDFKFSGETTAAMAVFIDKKFQRFAIILKNNETDAVITALKQKYGAPSSTSSQEDLQSAMKSGGSIYIRFDNDTVLFQGNRDADTLKDSFLLIYTSADYDSNLALIKSKGLKEDL